MIQAINLDSSFWFKGTGKKIQKIRDLVEGFNSDTAQPAEQTVYENYFFIALYSLWESEVYGVVYEIFQRYPMALTTEKFIEEYYKNIFSTRSKRTKEKMDTLGFKKILEISEIIKEKDLFFDTNNLWYSTLKDLFKKCDFNIEFLEAYFSQNDLSDLLVTKLSSIEFDVSGDEFRPERNVESYIDFLVSQRNSIAHSFKSPTGARFDKEVWLSLLDLFLEIFSALDNFLQDEILIKLLSNNFPELEEITNFEKVATKKSNSKKMKVNIKLNAGRFEPEEGAICVFMNKDISGFKKIKKFKIIKKETFTAIGYDYRLELEELYKTGTIRRNEGSLRFFTIK
ncbi:HEPN domain-containing protein [Streptococcus oralis]|uniref:RiboL-PSP-HEPN domain-containing protein n=1 Tax=Streptococcus oralis subsp. dentisani TaxID=1458253 RepID=A0A1X1IX96_STROR|nr:HEPN domain-containing protein [Streptococcus oralis]ORO77782.1 hypothetical protein B7709_05650 [Streptococcus oralis subsp. dentisani]